MRRRIDPHAMKKHGTPVGTHVFKGGLNRQNRDISNAGAFKTVGSMKLNERPWSRDKSNSVAIVKI